jgi:WD40 repeat protein
VSGMFVSRENRVSFRGNYSSKDTKIRVWNRETLELHRTLSGHQGPVNAIGLQNGFVVSASGDTKMKLWDIERGTCLRTFDGDRGLACIEFKVRVRFCCKLRERALICLAMTGQLHRFRLERLSNQSMECHYRGVYTYTHRTRRTRACTCSRSRYGATRQRELRQDRQSVGPPEWASCAAVQATPFGVYL